MFGDGVCIDPAANPCVLKPAAEKWRQTFSPLLDGGHCYGFAVLSLLLHRGTVQPSQYGGGDTTQSLRISDPSGNVTNPELHADIARSAATQFFDRVQRGAPAYTPTQAIAKLRQSFATPNDRDIVIAIQQPGVGGHAMVPTAIEDMGGGKFEILLYDNNFPYVPGNPSYSDRRMKIDTRADTWEYVVSLRPDAPQGRWSGKGAVNPMFLIPLAFNDIPAPCTFCNDAPPSTATSVVLGGDPGTTGHLRITDRQGRVTGWNGERFVNQIPGAELRRPFVIQREGVEAEPYIDLPPGGGYTHPAGRHPVGGRAGDPERHRPADQRLAVGGRPGHATGARRRRHRRGRATRPVRPCRSRPPATARCASSPTPPTSPSGRSVTTCGSPARPSPPPPSTPSPARRRRSRRRGGSTSGLWSGRHSRGRSSGADDGQRGGGSRCSRLSSSARPNRHFVPRTSPLAGACHMRPVGAAFRDTNLASRCHGSRPRKRCVGAKRRGQPHPPPRCRRKRGGRRRRRTRTHRPFAETIRQVAVPWARSLPVSSATTRPSAVAVVRPRCTTVASQRTRPVSRGHRAHEVHLQVERRVALRRRAASSGPRSPSPSRAASRRGRRARRRSGCSGTPAARR